MKHNLNSNNTINSKNKTTYNIRLIKLHQFVFYKNNIYHSSTTGKIFNITRQTNKYNHALNQTQLENKPNLQKKSNQNPN